MKPRISYLLVLMGIGIVLNGCKSASVYSDYVRGTDFSAYKTYAWLPDKDTAAGSIYENQIVMENIRQAVNSQMAAQGYSIDVTNPDLLVLVHTMFEEKEEYVRSPVYSSYNYYYPGFYPGPWYPDYYSGFYNVPHVTGYDIDLIEYTEGTIVVDVIDRKKNQLIWRGWSEDEIRDPKDLSTDLRENVQEIFEKFPG